MLNAQNFWVEDFTNGCTANCNANTFIGVNGAWTVTNTGTNDADNNQFYVSCAENGQNAGVCGAGCGTDASLHLGANASVTGDLGAAYLAGGLGVWFVETNLRAESPVIDCTGRTDIDVCFNYIEWGDGAIDDASLWYFDGATWSLLDPLSKTNCCGGVPCTGFLQGLWTSFTIQLPASANNNPNVRLGFNWTNNDDNIGTDPSFAVDDIILSTLPGSSPIAGSINVNCNDIGVAYNVTSNPGSTYNWSLSGGGTIASGQGTDAITIDWGGTPGVYTITMIETSCSGAGAPVTLDVTVSCVGTPPTSIINVSDDTICAGDCIDFLDASTGSPTSWNWDFTGGTPATSSNQNEFGVCYNTPGSYTVTLTATNASGSSTSTQTITVNPIPVVNITPNNPTLCNGDSVSMLATGATTYNWSPSTGLSDPNIANPDAFPVATTTYTVTGTSAGCSSTATTLITVAPGITANIASASTNVCIGDSIQLTASGGTNYSWTPDPTLSCVNCSDPYASPTVTTVYEVVVTSGTCSPDTANITITVSNPPNIVMGVTSDSICEGDVVNLSASGGTSYSWTPATGLSNAGISSPTASPLVSTIYTVTVTDANGCTAVDSVDLTVLPQPNANFIGDVLTGCTPLCVNLTDQSSISAGQLTGWIWIVEGQSTSPNQNETYCFTTGGNYDVSLIVTSDQGCVDTTTQVDYINTDDGAEASFTILPSKSVVPLGTELTFVNSSSGGTSYLWYFSNGDTSSLTSPVITVSDTGTFCATLVITDAGGCTDTVQQCIEVRPEFSLFFPNSFTPNEDEINPTWHVFGEGVNTISVVIFNRWGQEIFTISSMDDAWNGYTTNQQYCPQGVYVCRIYATDFFGEEYYYTSNINLLR